MQLTRFFFELHAMILQQSSLNNILIESPVVDICNPKSSDQYSYPGRFMYSGFDSSRIITKRSGAAAAFHSSIPAPSETVFKAKYVVTKPPNTKNIT
jgi:hypothetical protein